MGDKGIAEKTTRASSYRVVRAEDCMLSTLLRCAEPAPQLKIKQ